MRNTSTMNDTQAQEFIERMDAAAHRQETRCGPEEKMVWRRWGQGKPVVLLHGGAGSWLHWIRNIEPLARHHTVWVPDMPGFGDSDAPVAALDSDSIAPLVLQGALEVLGGAHFDLVGFSFGTLVAGEIAALAPPTLDHLILVSASGLGLFQGAAPLKSAKGITDPQEREAIKRHNLHVMMISDPALIDHLAMRVNDTSARRERVKNRTQARTDVMLHLAQRWRVPAYGIWGREDFGYCNQFEKLQSVVKTMPLKEAIFVEAAGHWAPYERNEEIDRILANIIDQE